VRRSRRDATDEELALFHETLHQVRPLRRANTASREVKRAAEPVHRAVPAPRLPVFAHGEAPKIGGHREAQLRRGRIEPEARIDLHGLTQEEAFRALVRFAGRERAKGHRVVLVITGKGGVLRSMLPRWLAEPELAAITAGIGPAHIKHGGPGAFYVALRRQRPGR
jgi:DNA-nicking Smr family endonuclease